MFDLTIDSDRNEDSWRLTLGDMYLRSYSAIVVESIAFPTLLANMVVAESHNGLAASTGRGALGDMEGLVKGCRDLEISQTSRQAEGIGNSHVRLSIVSFSFYIMTFSSVSFPLSTLHELPYTLRERLQACLTLKTYHSLSE